MFLGVLNTVFLNISNYLPHPELRNRSIQIVVVTNFVVISNVGIKRSDCVSIHYQSNFLINRLILDVLVAKWVNIISEHPQPLLMF